MSKEATGRNGAILGSGDYWRYINGSTFWGKLMRSPSETNYYETLQEVGIRANRAVDEIYNDLQNHIKVIRTISANQRNALAKLVQSLYDICNLANSYCYQTSTCIDILNLSSFYFPTNPYRDERAVQKAIQTIKNNTRFFENETIDLIQKAADWGISYAAGNDTEKISFLEEVLQGKGKDFLTDVLAEYHTANESADIQGACGYSIGSRSYLNYIEQEVFLQDLPAVRSDNLSGALKDALEYVAQQLRNDISENVRDNNYITDETAIILRLAVSDLVRCGINTGIVDSTIDQLAWYVGGDSNKIRQLQSKLNDLGIAQRLEEDGVYGKKTLESWQKFINQLENGTVPILRWIDPLKNNSHPLQIGSGLDGVNNIIQDAEIVREFSRGKQSYTEFFPYFRIDPPHQRPNGTYSWGKYRGNSRRLDYNHVNIEFSENATPFQTWLMENYNHYPLSDEAYAALKDLKAFGKTVRIAGKVLLVAGIALDALELGLAVQDDLTDADKKLGVTTASSVASIGGRWAGAAAGAELGAFVGGLSGPAAPVVIPVLSLVGGIAGSFGGNALGKWVVDITAMEE